MKIQKFYGGVNEGWGAFRRSCRVGEEGMGDSTASNYRFHTYHWFPGATCPEGVTVADWRFGVLWYLCAVLQRGRKPEGEKEGLLLLHISRAMYAMDRATVSWTYYPRVLERHFVS